MENPNKIVLFDQYCPNCKYWEEDEACDECNDCLNQPYNEHSHKPVNYKDKEEE